MSTHAVSGVNGLDAAFRRCFLGFSISNEERLPMNKLLAVWRVDGCVDGSAQAGLPAATGMDLPRRKPLHWLRPQIDATKSATKQHRRRRSPPSSWA
jgi:hypothetical protein